VITVSINLFPIADFFTLIAPVELSFIYLIAQNQNGKPIVIDQAIKYKISKINMFEAKSNGYWIHSVCPFGELNYR
jgi:hypothetical protein